MFRVKKIALQVLRVSTFDVSKRVDVIKWVMIVLFSNCHKKEYHTCTCALKIFTGVCIARWH